LLLTVMLFAGIGLQLVNPQVLRYFIDTARDNGDQQHLIAAAILFLGVVFVQQVLSVLAAYVSENLAWTSTNALRHDLAAHVLALDMGFHNTHTPGELIERIDGDVTTMASFFSEFVIQFAGNILLMIGVLVMLYTVDVRIGLAFTAFAVITLALLVRLRGLSIPYWVEGRKISAEMAGFLEERLAGTEDIRSNRATAHVMDRFYRLMRSLLITYRHAHLASTVPGVVTRFALIVSIAIGLGLGSYLYQHHEISIGSVVLIIYYAGVMSWPLFAITDKLDDLQQASAGLARVTGLRAVPNAITDGPGVALDTDRPSLAFEDVTFGYGDAEPVLHDLSFSLQPGEVLGLLGRTGSGKTTISRLVFRLYEPQVGRITISGVDIRRFRLAELRSLVGLVTQEVQLFHASVRDNLTFFDASVPDSRLLDAIHALGLDAWYGSLPQGLDTQLAGGGGLSAGEAQVLALTRVFLKDPAIVILDEASSRLDPATERLIEHAVERLLAGRAAIVIAHRLSTVRRADSIMILSDGRVSEYGPRERLAANPSSVFSGLLRTGLEPEPV
jgi:ABC-type multidrug transport system fused ATPase/permease subunit